MARAAHEAHPSVRKSVTAPPIAPPGSRPISQVLRPTSTVAISSSAHQYFNADGRYAAHPRAKCQEPRQRWPATEAVVQVFFRTIQFLLDLAIFMLVLIARETGVMWPAMTYNIAYLAVAFSIVLGMAEILSLTAPAFGRLRRFPRMPSLALATAEALAVSFTVWAQTHLVQQDTWTRDAEGWDVCPEETCVTRDEYKGIMVYGCMIVTVVSHLGFFIMAVKHVLGRNVEKVVKL